MKTSRVCAEAHGNKIIKHNVGEETNNMGNIRRIIQPIKGLFGGSGGQKASSIYQAVVPYVIFDGIR